MCMDKQITEKTKSEPLGEGTAEVSSLTGLGIAGVAGRSDHESAVGALVTQMEENLSCNLSAEEDMKHKAATF